MSNFELDSQSLIPSLRNYISDDIVTLQLKLAQKLLGIEMELHKKDKIRENVHKTLMSRIIAETVIILHMSHTFHSLFESRNVSRAK